MARRHVRVLLIAATAVVGSVLAITSVASADSGNGRNQPFLGNLVSSKPLDRITVGHNSTSCTITVEPGRDGGKFAAPIVVPYSLPVLKGKGVDLCPDMGVTVPTGRLYDDLVVTWFIQPVSGPAIYLLRNFYVQGSGGGQITPSYVGSQDFNGDGKGDIWETTDEGDGFTTYIRSGNGFVPGPLHFESSNAAPVVNFGNLDGKPGTDFAAAYANYNGRPSTWSTGVIVGFGGSGTMKVLESDPTANIAYTTKLMDYNGDGFTDVQVSGGPNPPRIYYNDGAGNFSLVAPGTPVATPSPVPTVKPTASPIATPTPTGTPAPTAIPTASPAPTVAPTVSPAPSASPVPTASPAPVATPTPVASPTGAPAAA